MDILGFIGLGVSAVLTVVGLQSGDPEARLAVAETVKCLLPISLGFIAVGRLGTVADHLLDIKKELREINSKTPGLPDSSSSKEKGK